FHVSREYVQRDEGVVEVGAYDERESANAGPANHRLWLDVAVVSIFSPNQPSDQWQELSLHWSILGADAAGSARPPAHRSIDFLAYHLSFWEKHSCSCFFKASCAKFIQYFLYFSRWHIDLSSPPLFFTLRDGYGIA